MLNRLFYYLRMCKQIMHDLGYITDDVWMYVDLLDVTRKCRSFSLMCALSIYGDQYQINMYSPQYSIARVQGLLFGSCPRLS